MTLSTTSSSITYQGNSAATTFSYSFPIPEADEVVISLTNIATSAVTVIPSGQYSITGIGGTGGIVTYPLIGSPITSAYNLTIQRIVPLVQETELVNQSGYYPQVVEDALDYLTMEVQQMQEQINRELIIPVGAITNLDDFMADIIAAAAAAQIAVAASQQLQPSRAAISALTPVSGTTSFIQAEGYASAGDGGAALWKKVNANPSPVLSVQAADATWFKYVETVIKIEAAGAVCDGVTDDLAAWNRCIAQANSTGYCAIVVPPGLGTYISSDTNAITADHVYIVCLGGTSGRIKHAPNIILFTWDNAFTGGGFIGGSIEVVGVATTGNLAFFIRSGSRWSCLNTEFINVGQILEAGVDGGTSAQIITIENPTGYCANVGATLYHGAKGSGLFISGGSVYVGGVSVPINPAALTTAVDRTVLRLNGTWDTVVMTGGLYELFYRAVDIDCTAAKVINNVWVRGTIFDYSGQGVKIDCAATGNVVSVRFLDCWITAWDGVGVTFSGAGAISYCSLINNLIFLTYTSGVVVNATCADVQINGNRIFSNNRSGGAGDGIVLAGGIQSAMINGNRIGLDTTSVGLPYRCRYGINIAADSTNYVITGNIVEGATAGFLIADNTTLNTTRRIGANGGTPNYAGVKNGGTWALPASTVAWGNKTPFMVHAMLFGGTVTVVANEGVTTGATAGTFPIRPGGSLTVTYSVAPTLNFLVEP